MTTTQANINSAAYRADNPRAHTLFSREQQRTIWTRSLERLESAGMGWTTGAQELRTRLAAMETN